MHLRGLRRRVPTVTAMFATFLEAVAGAAAAQVDHAAYSGRPDALADVGRIAAERVATGLRLLGGPDDAYGRSEAAYWGGYAGHAAGLTRRSHS